MEESQNEDFTKFRRRIDELDILLVEILGQRLEICREIARYKKENSIPVMQSSRMEDIKNGFRTKSVENGLCVDFGLSIIELILQESHRVQNQIIQQDGT